VKPLIFKDNSFPCHEVSAPLKAEQVEVAPTVRNGPGNPGRNSGANSGVGTWNSPSVCTCYRPLTLLVLRFGG
jgi:hypothetical protein